MLRVLVVLIHAQVIVTSYLFPDAKFSQERLETISKLVGKDRLVVDVRSDPPAAARRVLTPHTPQLSTQR